MLRKSERLPPPWEEIFGPLRRGLVDDLVVVGQFGQSIDARIATATGHSHYINGAEGLTHLHRLRALVDAVVVGVGTALADDPQLTVRRVAGPSPARVVIDPNGRLPPIGAAAGRRWARRLVIVADRRVARDLPAGVERVRLPRSTGAIAPAAILSGTRRARLPPHPDRRRRRHRVALPGGGLPRPAARGDRADHHRRRPVERHASRRSRGSTRRCGHRCVPTCSATRCCSTATFPLSGSASAARRNRRDRRAWMSGRGHQRAPPREPVRNRAAGRSPSSCAACAKPRRHLVLNSPCRAAPTPSRTARRRTNSRPA